MSTDLIEYDGSRTPLLRLIAEAVVFFLAVFVVACLLWLATA